MTRSIKDTLIYYTILFVESFQFLFFLNNINSSLFTLISPSTAPVTMNSSWGSIAMHLIGCSCALKKFICRWVCLMSQIPISPFFPPVISWWCWVAYKHELAPASWNIKPWIQLRFCGINVSQRATFLPSELWPAVQNKLELPPWNTKSLVCFEWHWWV